MKIDGRRTWCRTGAAMALSLVFGIAFAHIKNEASQFPDIEFSEARFDIVVLVGAGIIPETPVFEPDKPLSKRELAAWVGLARGLGAGGETPDTDALAEAARASGAIDSLEGDATYADLNRLFFDEALAPDSADRRPTKAEAAMFIASNLESETGRALLEDRGMRFGDTGEVVSVTTEQGHHGNVYVVTIGDVTRRMHEHGRVANGPTDVLQWQGRYVRRSFVSGTGADAVWSYLEAEPLEEAAPQQTASAAPDVSAATPLPDRRPLYWLVAGVVVLGLVLFFRRRRSA